MLSPGVLSADHSSERSAPVTWRRDLVSVFLVAAALRLVAGVMLSGTYDYDEFIQLALSRQFAQGLHPYRDFVFFHPPGALLVGRALDPLTELWWPAARVFTGLIDAATAALTSVIAARYLARRPAMAAGLLYAASPLTLISGVRIGPDPLIAFLGVAGLCVLLRSRSAGGALVAGVLLGLAIGTKYTAVLLLPAYVAAAPRRAWASVAGASAGLALLLAPYLPTAHALLQQTVVFQSGRSGMGVPERLATAALYWLAVAPLAVIGMGRRTPVWVKIGFLAGGALLFTPQTYYHYFVLFAPYAALLSAPVLCSLRWPAHRTVAMLMAYGLAWVTVVVTGNDRPLLITAARLAEVAPTAELLQDQTPAGGLVMADRYEYPFLAGRSPLTPYFWNVRTLVKGSTLMRQLPCAAAVVEARGASSGYPQGLTTYLDRHYRAVRSEGATVWVLAPRRSAHQSASSRRAGGLCERFALVPRQPCLARACVPGRSTDAVDQSTGASGASVVPGPIAERLPPAPDRDGAEVVQDDPMGVGDGGRSCASGQLHALALQSQEGHRGGRRVAGVQIGRLRKPA